MLQRLLHISLPLILVLALVGCDSVPGEQPALLQPPVLSDFAYSPRVFNIAQQGGETNGEVSIQFDISVDVQDPDGEVDVVRMMLLSPDSDAEPVAESTLQPGAGSLYQLVASLQLPAALTGNYTLVVFAVDDDGLLSNQVRGRFVLEDISAPPVIEDVELPATLTRPGPGASTELQIVAVVSDPDGLANVASVVFWNVERPNDVILLFDDGQSGGDEAAGDGRYTITVVITSENALGTNTFAFQATDRSGLKSEVVERSITIE